MNTDKAYLLGLIIGGGIFGNAEDVLRIRLPYKKWGSYIANPERAGQIAGDILKRVGEIFRAIYNVSVQYETTPGGNWTILCEGDVSGIREDLKHYGIPCDGEIRGNADLGLLINELVDDNLKRRFIAGIADTIGSMAKSQRRFSDEHQIISIEIKGYNFKFVCDLCRLLYSINCIPDQVNWNHPNIHCPSDPYYRQWNKGFKLRILLDQYSKFGAFAFRTKAETSIANRSIQRQTHTAEKCEERDFHITPSAVHPAENDSRLPMQIRGGHYVHFRHFCAVLGCEHAPFRKINACLNNLDNMINPFPILSKVSHGEVEQIISDNQLMASRKYTTSNVLVSFLKTIYDDNNVALLYGNTIDSGYPISAIMQAVAYIVADETELHGKRPKGGYYQIIEKHIQDNPGIAVEVRVPELLTPMVIVGNGRGTLIGAKNPSVYHRLISRDSKNKYKILVRSITEEDLMDGEKKK